MRTTPSICAALIAAIPFCGCQELPDSKEATSPDEIVSQTSAALSVPVCGTASENGTLTLSCPSGQTITSVTFASYGTPTGSCGSFSKGTCDASTSASVFASSCAGKNSCSVVANNTVFNDPCFGTVKRLYAQVSCSGDTLSGSVCATAPENASATLSCPTGQVLQSITFASYGTPAGSCGAFTKGTCDAATSTSVVSNACVGKASCTVNAGNGVFGDPCLGTLKRLNIQARCGSSPPDAGAGDTGSKAGNPYGSCSKGLPANAQPVDVSHPTSVVGSGAGCSFAELQAAVAKGGIITFNCGSGPFTIPVTATLRPPINQNTVIDGGNKITLDGRQAVQIIRFDSPNFQANDKGLTLQHLTLINGKATPTQAIPPAPAPCSQGWNDGEGGAVYVRDGYLTVIDSIFMNNQAAPLGPDTGGGAIYALGSKGGVLIAGSTFTGNSASNAGAVGGLFAPFNVYNSLFTNNDAIGSGANDDDASRCSAINNGQHEVGSGGNGGALYNDGASVNVYLCGNAILNNHAGQGAFGGGLFFTSNDLGGTLTIVDTSMTGNTGGWWTQVATGTVRNVGTAVGTNAKSITLQSSTLQGLN